MHTNDLIPTPFGPRIVSTSAAFAGTRGSRLLELARWRREATFHAAAIPAEAVVTVRLATFCDIASIEQVAALEEADVPGGALLVAEVDGRVRAVLALAGGRILTDPFYPSASLASLLRARAAQLPARESRAGLTPVCC